ncbi:MAG: glycosyltransferase [Bacilli bacterium]|nr:glycosyltransferase [Bacilli bacterium]
MKIFSFFKNVVVLMWQRHHFLIPPKYWKKYFCSFIRKINNKREYLNPFVVKEYNTWLKTKTNVKEVSLAYKPLISFVIPVYNIEPEYLKDCLESILNQSYQNFEICLADDKSTNPDTIKTLKEYESKDSRIKVNYRKENGHISKATNTALEMVTGDYVALMDDDDILTVDALYQVAWAINKYKDIDFIYSDEDKQDMDGNYCEPHFKPDFSEYSFNGGNYICHFTAIKKSLLDEVGGFRHEYVGAQDFDLFLRCTEKAKHIYHIPEILYHWRKVPGSTADTIGNKNYAIENGKKAVEESLKRKGIDGYVTVPIKTTHYIVHYNLPVMPKISVIMIDNSKSSAIKNIRKFKDLNYKNLEIIVNYKELRGYENVIFSSETDINKLISLAKGEYILIVSGKISIKNADILKEMVGYASRDNVGVVGPKIYHYGKMIKSAGLILSNKYIYSDAFKDYFNDSYGLYGRLLVPYNYSALSDVFMMFSRRKYDEVGGFRNDVNFVLSSIDFCLKLISKNYQNILLSYLYVYQKDNKRIQLYQMLESEKDILRASWNLDDDKYYNNNLSKLYPFMLGVDDNEK